LPHPENRVDDIYSDLFVNDDCVTFKGHYITSSKCGHFADLVISQMKFY